MNHIRYILFAPLFVLGACSSGTWEDIELPKPEEMEEEFSNVNFSASMNQGQEGDGDTPYFRSGDEIRISTPSSYATPDFDKTGGYYTYVYSEKKDDEYPYKFEEKVEGSGFDWRTLQPTSIYYFFEAMYFPGKGHQYYKDVPYRQDNVANYLKADLLLAHHRVPISERGNNVQLFFHHAFAMVEVEVTLPEAETPIDGVFPRDAMEEVYMRDMLITYDVNYAEVISNDGLRTTRGLLEDDGGTRKNVTMYKLEDKREPDASNDKIIRHTYIYRGIVPAQAFDGAHNGADFLYFMVKENNGSDKLTKYRFTPNKSLTLNSSTKLKLRLTIQKGDQEAALLRTEIQPWSNANANILAEKQNTTNDTNR